MEFYGLVGEKLTHSLSPQIHRRVFELLNIEGAYKLFEIKRDEIKKLGAALKLLGIKGVNVTIPYKEEVINELDYISPEARKIGAINTILQKDGNLYGYNTDYYGFGIMLKSKNISVKDKSVVVLGNGGAARAINAYLLDNNVKELYLVSRSKFHNNTLDERIKLIDYKELENIKGDLLINTTPVGMYPNIGKSPVDSNIINNFNALADIIYNPECTEFLRLGKELGKVTCGGLLMLVGQAIKSEEIWQDKEINEEVIDLIFKEIEGNFK